MARAASGSRCSMSSIDPLMSANSIVTVLRSSSAEESGVSAPTSIGELAAAAPCDLPLVPSSGFAHSRQNLAVGGFSAVHDGHRRAHGEAHWTQNFARSGFSAPHFEQRIAPLSLEPYGASRLRATSATITFNSENSRSCPTNSGDSLRRSRALEDVIGPPPVEDAVKPSVMCRDCKLY